MAPRVWIFSQLLLLMATAISAAERTEVAVGFELSATEYRVEFRDETLPQLARDAAEALGVLLAEQVRYLRFTADGESPFRLSFRLDRADPSAGGSQHEFGIYVRLEESGSVVGGQLYWVFRDAEHAGQPVGSAAALVREIRDRVGRPENLAELRRHLLNRVGFTRGARFMRQPLLIGWRLEHSHEELCMDRDTILEVECMFPLYGEPFEDRFRAKVIHYGSQPSIFGAAERDDDMQWQLLQAPAPDEVSVRNVRVVEYRRRCRDGQQGGASTVSFE